MKSDIEVAREYRLSPIAEIAAKLGDSRDRAAAARAHDRQDRRRFPRQPEGAAGGQADSRHRDQSDARRRGQDHHHDRPRRRSDADRRAHGDLPARAFARPLLRPEGGRDRRRARAGRADGRDQPAFHRRFPCDHVGAQSARRDDRQSYSLGQRARNRCASRRLAARARHERSRAARDRRRHGRPRQRLRPRGRLRHHRRLRGDGDVLPERDDRGHGRAARPDDRRLHAGQETGHREGHQGRRRR